MILVVVVGEYVFILKINVYRKLYIILEMLLIKIEIIIIGKLFLIMVYYDLNKFF